MKEQNEQTAQQEDSRAGVRVAQEENPKEKSVKSPAEQRAAERQCDLLAKALAAAADAKGQWLNAAGKLYPKFYPNGLSVSPFNALVLALASDARGCSTNLFTLFPAAKARQESVRKDEKGVPFLYYNWKEYVNRNNPNDVIPREEYLNLPEEQQRQYKGVHNREVRMLYNIDQTTMPMKKDEYAQALRTDGGAAARGVDDNGERALHSRYNAFLSKMKDNLVPVRRDGSGVAHYDTIKDVVYLPRQRDYEHFGDYVQEGVRQLVAATGHQQRLAREGMVAANGVAPSEDAVRQERLVTELASGVKMLEMGLPARLADDSLGMVEYWTRELKENPRLIDAIESDVNNALNVMRKAERGEKVVYATMRNRNETAHLQEMIPKHYFVADEIRQHPDKEARAVVIVRDDAGKTADVVLPQGASTEADNEIKGMSKQRFTVALQKEGYDTVRFYNPDGALGYRPDDGYFADKKITVSRLNNWRVENLSTLDAADAVKCCNDVVFDNVQMIRDDKERWALFIKPEGKESFAVYPDKSDLNRFFTTLKQATDDVNGIRIELAQKYYAMAQAKPEMKVELFGAKAEAETGRIQRVAVFRAKSGAYLCAATIDGRKRQARVVSPSQWQRLWLAPDRDAYKQRLAATLYADILQKEQAHEQQIGDKREADVKDEQKTVEERQTAAARQEDGQEKKKDDTKTLWNNGMFPSDKQYGSLKERHPEALLLFRAGDFYTAYNDDAVKASKILDIATTHNENAKKGGLTTVLSFPHKELDTCLPKLVHAGARVAICDMIEEQEQKQEEVQTRERDAEQQSSRGMRR